MGTNNSCYKISALLSISTNVGYTKFPGLSMTSPPQRTFPPYFLISIIPFLKVSIYIYECKGPHKIPGSRGSPIEIDG